MKNEAMLHPAMPWWRVPTVWLVLAGPSLVVVASMITLVIAIKGGDKPLRTSVVVQQPISMTPAAQARNHAATAAE